MAATATKSAGRDKRPDYIKKEAIALPPEESLFPAINIIHDLSPQNNPGDPEFIKGAKTGMLFNSVNKSLYNGTTGVRVQVLMVTKQWIEWAPRDTGGGFVRSYSSREDADNSASDGNNVQPSVSYYCRMVDEEGEDGNPPVIVIRLGTPSKMKIARKWNFLIEESQSLSGMVYKVTVQMETNKKKQRYYNFNVEPDGWVIKALYQSAQAARTELEKGQLALTGGNGPVGDM